MTRKHDLGDEIEKVAKSNLEIQKEIETLNNHNNLLSIKLQAGPGWTDAQQCKKKNLLDEIQDIVNQLFQKRLHLSSIQKSISETNEAITNESNDQIAAKHEFDKITQEISSHLEDINIEQGRYIELQRDKVELDLSIQQAHLLTASKEQELQELNNIRKLKQSKAEKVQADIMKINIEQETLEEESKRLLQELDVLGNANTLTRSENDDISKFLKKKKNEFKSVNKKCNQMKQEINTINAEIEKVVKDSNESEKTQHELKMKLHRLETVDLKCKKRDWEILQREIERLLHEDQCLDRQCSISNKKKDVILELIDAQEAKLIMINNELNDVHGIIEQKRFAIQTLKYSQQTKISEIEGISIRCNALKQTMQEQDAFIHTMEKEIKDSEMKAKNENVLGSSIKSESNRESKHLHDNQEKLEKLFIDYNTIRRQMKSCKHDMAALESHLISEHCLHYTCDADAEELRKSVAQIRDKISKNEAIVEHQMSEIQKLCDTIEQANNENVKLTKENLLMMVERDGVMVQLSQSECELKMIQEVISGRTSEMNTSNHEFQSLTKQLSILTSSIELLHKQQHEVTDYFKHQQERIGTCVELENQVNLVRSESKILHEELQRPINIHRWRVLEQLDPKKFDKIKRLQKLQRKLIEKTDEVSDVDRIIWEKKKMINELFIYLERMPKMNVLEEELVLVGNILNDRVDHWKRIKEGIEINRKERERLRKIIEWMRQVIRRRS